MPAGQVVSIIGPSGSGKSTLLRVLMTLETPAAGEITIDGEPLYRPQADGALQPTDTKQIRRVRRKLSMVFQHFNLFPHMTVLRNVTEAPVHVLGLSRDEARERALKYLHQVDLSPTSSTPIPPSSPAARNNGWPSPAPWRWNRRSCCSTRSPRRSIPSWSAGSSALLEKLAAAGEMTMLIVTHHMNFARASSDRVLFFDHGVILEDGEPEQIFTNPRHARTRAFLQDLLEL